MLFFTANKTPELKELQHLITPNYAHCWKEIGIELTLSYTSLEIIEANHPKVEQRCTNMLAKWLQEDVSATWQKLLQAIDSPAVAKIFQNSESPHDEIICKFCPSYAWSAQKYPHIYT